MAISFFFSFKETKHSSYFAILNKIKKQTNKNAYHLIKIVFALLPLSQNSCSICV